MTTANLDSLAQLKQKIDTREARIGIVGMGYVGLPLALLFSGERFKVTGFDISADKVAKLNAGESYIVRILPAMIQEAQKSGFRATSDYTEIEAMDAVIICVPTPLNDHHEPDLTYITGTVASIAPHIHQDQLIVLESTTYPGTTEEIVAPMLEAGNPHGLKVARTLGEPGVHVVFSPEREDPGNDTVARRDIPKVVGGCGPAAAELASALYGTIFRRVVQVSTPSAAEMTKLLENIYRCVNIALVNEPRGDRRGQNQALRIPGLLSRPRTGRPLHPHRPLLFKLEGQGVRLSYPLHRAGRRGQYRHAVLRDRAARLGAEQ
jgi:UDP-N-acetyl-D-glucosamine dehydrogenase